MTSVYIGIAGTLGALTRYAFSLLWNSTAPNVFPWGTLFCNLAGCFLLSFLAHFILIRLPEQLHLAVTTGYIGSFTTFSALSFESFSMIDSGHPFLAMIYMLASLSGGLFFAWLGSRAAIMRPAKGICP